MTEVIFAHQQIERGTTIRTIADPLPPLPNDRELKRLFEIVRARYPDVPAYNAIGFKVAFIWSQVVGRGDAPNRQRFVGFWHDEAEVWARSAGFRRDSLSEMLFAAIIASADIPYQLAAPGWSPSWGLQQFGGKKSNGAWRGLLDGTRALLTPTPPPPLPVASRPRQLNVGENISQRYVGYIGATTW